MNHLKIASFIANALDNQFNFLGFRFGLSALIDLIPGVGDVVDAALSFYLVWIGIQMGLPSDKVALMVGNVVLNFVIGLIPVIGDVAYLFRKANMRNLAILQEFASQHSSKGRVIEGVLLR